MLIFNSKGENIRLFGSDGTSNGRFYLPYGVAVDGNGDILVADGRNNNIQKFSSNDRYITAIGTHGSGQLQFQTPVGIKIHPLTKRLYVGECWGYRIQILNPDLSYFGSIGSQGRGPGQMNQPWDIACDSANNVYVTDKGNNRIQVFTEDGKLGKKGAGKGDLDGPAMIAISHEDKIYVTECNNCHVSVFTTQGDHLTSFGTNESGPQQF